MIEYNIKNTAKDGDKTIEREFSRKESHQSFSKENQRALDMQYIWTLRYFIDEINYERSCAMCGKPLSIWGGGSYYTDEYDKQYHFCENCEKKIKKLGKIPDRIKRNKLKI